MRKNLLKGSKFTVYAWVDEKGECPVELFLKELLADGNSDAAQVIKRLQQLADGHNLRQEAGHPLENELCLVKSSGMTRLVWFYDETERAVIVCTHCFRKPAGDKYGPEQKSAIKIRQKYLEMRDEQEKTDSQTLDKRAKKSSKKSKGKKK